MIKFFAFAATMLATPAFAGEVRVSDCATSGNGFIRCNVSNGKTVAIASVSYISEILEDGRTVPWFPFGDTQSRKIDGGIEPGETLPLVFLSGSVGQHSKLENLRITVQITEALDVNGEPIK